MVNSSANTPLISEPRNTGSTCCDSTPPGGSIAVFNVLSVVPVLLTRPDGQVIVGLTTVLPLRLVNDSVMRFCASSVVVGTSHADMRTSGNVDKVPTL